MKPISNWLELTLFAAALTAIMVVVAWAQRPDASCTLSFEAPRPLVLSRETDREHLDADRASADRIARRYMLSTVDPGEQHSRFVQCEAALVQQIATRHGLPPDRVRAGLADAR
jgi:hypothetical protein